MSQRIHLAAIIAREGRLFLVREDSSARWELPGGPFLPEHPDTEAGMGAILREFGVSAAAREEDYLETLFLSDGEGHMVYNLYAAQDWEGEPEPPEGQHHGWFAPEELDSLAMNAHVRDAVLELFGTRERPDRSREMLEALRAGVDDVREAVAGTPTLEPPAGGRRERGLDVLRTLSGATAQPGAERLEQRYGPLAGDVIDFAMGEVWSAPALDRRTRSLQVVAMLGALGRSGPLASHIAGALNHGATPEELAETVRMVAVYAGFPAALGAWEVMARVFVERGIPVPEGPE